MFNDVINPIFIIGAQRAGTSFLFRELSLHEDICPSFHKELNYFSYNFDPNPDKYFDFYSFQSNTSAFLDASPSYLFSRYAPKLIKQFFKKPLIIILLRDPVSRYVSAVDLVRETQPSYKSITPIKLFKKEYNCYKNLLPSEFALESTEQSSITTLGVGLYYYHLKNWFSYFDKSCFFIRDFNNFFSNISNSMFSLYEFLGLSYRSPCIEKLRVGTNNYTEHYVGQNLIIEKFYKCYNKKLSSLNIDIQYD